jgi:hypothetical protein
MGQQGDLVEIIGTPPLPTGASTEATLASLLARLNPHRAGQVAQFAAAVNTAGTLTLAAPGAGLYHWISRIFITRTATGAVAGTLRLFIGSTNLWGWQVAVGNLIAAGEQRKDYDASFAPMRSQVANTATTITFPAPGALTRYDALVHFYIADISGD